MDNEITSMIMWCTLFVCVAICIFFIAYFTYLYQSQPAAICMSNVNTTIGALNKDVTIKCLEALKAN